MMKRIIALLLALILTIGLLPTVALAAGETKTAEEPSGVDFVKKLVTKNGKDYLCLEALVNGDIKTVKSVTPCDIVLVLDQSGSMDETVKQTTYTYKEVDCKEWSYNKVREYLNKGTKLYYQPCRQCGEAHEVRYWENNYWFNDDTYQIGYQCGWNWYVLRDSGKDDENVSRDYVFYTGTLYTRTATTTTTNKFAALKAAANAFLTTVLENAKQYNVDHRVAIVGFGSAEYDYTNTEILTLKNGNTVGKNYNRLNKTDYQNALVACNTNGAINSTLTNAVNALDANGATAVDLGLEMANNIFKNQPDGTYTGEKARAKIVVVVTDGNPTHSTGFKTKVANNAIKNAKNLKDAKAMIFTVGIALSDNDATKFISYVSSDYPNAAGWNSPGAPIAAAPKYTNYVSDAEAMKEIFSDIASEATSVSASAKLTQTAVLTDTISQYFKLPEGATKDSIEVYTSAAKFKDGAFTWEPEEKLTNANVKIDGQKIEVTGFDYTANCVTKTAKSKEGTDFGKKLVIYIPIEKDATKAQFGGYLPTNTDATLGDTKGDTGFTAQSAHKDCTVVAPKLAGKTITIKVGEKATTTELFKNITPDGTEWPDGNNNAGVDLKYTIMDEQRNTIATAEVPAGTSTVTWTFADGKTDANQYAEAGEYKFTIDCEATCKNKTAHEGSTANSKQATGIIKVEPTTATVTLTKEITGSLTDAEKQSVLTKLKVYAKLDENNKTELVKGSDGKYSVTLQAGNYTIEETNYTVDGYTCTSKLNNSDTFMFTVVAGQNQTLTLTNTYETIPYTVTYTDGVENETIFADDVHNNVAYGSTIPGFTSGTPTREGYNFNSWKWYNSTDTAYESEITPAPTTMPAYNLVAVAQWTPAINTKYIVEHYLQNLTGDGYTEPETETKTGTTGTTATATPKTYPGFTCDESVEGTIKSGTIAANGSLVLKLYYTRNSYTVKYQYTGTVPTGASTLPPEVTYKYGAEVTVAENATAPDHDFSGWGTTDASINNDKFVMPAKNVTLTGSWTLKDPTAVNVDLNNHIYKTFTSDTADIPNDKLTFNVTVSGKSDNAVSMTRSGSVEFTKQDVQDGRTSKAFAFASDSLTFTAAGEYTFEVVEGTTPVINGLTYNVNNEAHLFTIVVDKKENANELYVKEVRVGTAEYTGNALTATLAYATITNNYVEPKNAQVTKKEVVVTQPTDPLKTAVDAFAHSNGLTVLYPTGDGVLNNTLEVPYGTTSVTLLYKITVNAGTQTSMQFRDEGAKRVSVFDDDDVDVSQVGDNFIVQFYRGVTTADIYVAKTYRNLVFDSNGECTVENVISEEIKATTTVKEKDPNKLYINFSDFVQKELTATGTKTASDVDFRVNVKGGENLISKYSEGEEEVNADANKYNTVLDVHFDSITGGTVETKKFTGNTVEIDHAGHYYFDLSEEKGTRTGVTYDETTYTLYVTVEEQAGSLVITNVHFYDSNDGEYDASQKITFHNTIDTGIDDYYPIIIPTIINKDTGMLNKTDHFAYVIGYPDGTVHPNGQITRSEVATIFFRLLRDEVRDGAFTTSNSYSDVAYGKWYNNPISTMSALGIITGYPDGTFKPNKPITRAEFAAIAARFDETQSGKSATFSDVIGHWAAKEIGIAYYNDWIKGYPDGTFKPDQNITRAEAMTLINRVLERKPESPADLLTNMNKWTDNMDTSKWYYLDVQEATNSHGYTRKTFNYELWRQMLPDPDWSRYER